MHARALMILIGILIAFVAQPSRAQYIYTDVDGDGVHTDADVLGQLGNSTLVEVWLDTNHRRDGSEVLCPDGGTLTMSSYVVNLHVSGGTALFSDFTNEHASFTIAVRPFASDSVEMTAGQAGPAHEAPGRYRLFRVTITGLTGSPSVAFSASSGLGVDATSFGSICGGLEFDNTCKLGLDWFDADGIGYGGLSASGIFPTELLRGQENRVLITGGNFGAGASVEFASPFGQLTADTTAVLASDALLATVGIPFAWSGPLDVIVRSQRGDADTLRSGVLAVNTQRAMIDESNSVVTGLNPDYVILSPDQVTLLCPQPPVGCSAQDTISVLAPPGGCSGPDPFTGKGGYTFFFRDQFGQVTGKNCIARLRLAVLDNGGGHCHTDPDHPLGTPIDTTATTGSDGLQFKVAHRWPEVGGMLLGFFWSTQPGCPDYNDSTTASYIFCLANQSFFSPRHAIYTQGPGDTLVGALPEHPDNHIAIPAMLDSIRVISTIWAGKYPTGPKLSLNDMAIYGGGVFDAKYHNWVASRDGHCGHRAGMEVDLSIRNLRRSQVRGLDTLLESHGFRVAKHKGERAHWHLYFHGRGTYTGPGSTLREGEAMQ